MRGGIDKIENIRNSCSALAAFARLVEPEPGSLVAESVLAVFVVLLSADDVGQMDGLDGEENVSQDGVGAMRDGRLGARLGCGFWWFLGYPV